MKKFSLFIFCLLSLFIISACSSNKTLDETTAKDKFLAFTNSSNLEYDAYLKLTVSQTEITTKLFSYQQEEEKFMVDFSDTDLISDKLFLYYDDLFDRLLLGNETEGYITKLNSNGLTTDFANYLTDFSLAENVLKLKLDLAGLISNSTNLPPENEIEPINVKVYFANLAIEEISYDLNGLAPTMGTNTEIIIKNIKMEATEVNIPVYTSKYQTIANEDFFLAIVNLMSSLNPTLPGNPDNNPDITPDDEPSTEIKYGLRVHDSYDISVKADNIDAYGTIYSSLGTSESVSLKLETAIPFHEAGSYPVRFSYEYLGTTYYADSVINIIDSTIKPSNLSISIQDKIKNSFIIDNYLYLATKDKLYKYDLTTNSLVGNAIDIKCRANKIVPYGDYLYVLANYEYSSEYLDEYQYRGTITKINKADFTIATILDVNYYPYDVDFKDENTLFVTKGLNQHVSLEEVDLVNKISKPILGSYAKDNILYDKENEIIYIIENYTKAYQFDATSNQYINIANPSIIGNIDYYYRIDNKIFTYNGYFDISNLNNITFNSYDILPDFASEYQFTYDKENKMLYILADSYNDVYDYVLISYNLDTESTTTNYIVSRGTYTLVGAYANQVYIYNSHILGYDIYNF